MNKYAHTPEATLDLHGHTRLEARAVLARFLKESEDAGRAYVRIIVGRGLHSKDGPVLGAYVRELLREQDYDFSDAKITQGAAGALDVKIAGA